MFYEYDEITCYDILATPYVYKNFSFVELAYT